MRKDAIHRPRLESARSSGPLADVLAEATGRRHREDPVRPGSGGPAGNAVLTAWTGLVLLVLFVAELLTLFDVRGLISWHVAIGALLIPVALVKTASVGWRLVRYYRGEPHYVSAGPPVLILRMLGPLVVASTLALLGSGVLLVILGEPSARAHSLTLVGFRIDWITAHQAAFAVWATATGLHLLGRLVPALQLTLLRVTSAARGHRVPGALRRVTVLALAVTAAALLAVVLVGAKGGWGDRGQREAGPGQTSQP